MNSYTLFAIVVLALVSTGAYFLGTKKNRWIASTLTKGLEEVLKPLNSNYVNIGGSIGYNFAYSLPNPYTSAKGTITLSPRHSLLYLPFSLLIGVRDRFFVNVFTKKKLRGEGHIVEAGWLKKANITGMEQMERRDVQKGTKSFVLLWRGADLSADLERLLDALPEPARLRHFCSYPETRTFFIHGLPKQGSVRGNLEAVVVRLPGFLTKEKE
ncbi:MAG: hypothetical protein A2Z99_04925 [Treponema sp. GWB1_62_6]|nr:MAG: hypothetical protein A2Y36_12525 [Treponema sp. GWA1_62_8]OHE63366.1 MAG: hypothetical protein A2001_15785 [Treponema sp. GWC1_61_84]OHE67259.1 MAG: hypothetical protein A2Z99_04925 [Treponema sp. GWB1_62_6]OHE73132.1 MAG: hypothetical protein A2413_10270 [Treponema sp. RIFOXYC1_FULL_61_9]HCM25291.1 hypothetical protein [Treponema sp.]